MTLPAGAAVQARPDLTSPLAQNGLTAPWPTIASSVSWKTGADPYARPDHGTGGSSASAARTATSRATSYEPKLVRTR